MTLPLLDSWDIQPVEGAKYKVNSVCARPGCGRAAEHGHHLVRRSQIIGDVWWIRLPDGMVIGNVIGLCAPHHDEVTGRIGGHKAAIRWAHGELWWATVEQTWDAQGFASGITYNLDTPLSIQTPLGSDEAILQLEDVGPHECPTCGRSKKAPKGPKREARKRKTFTVQVPHDNEEDGAQIMDDYIEALVRVFELDPDGGAMTRYHALTRACAFVLVNESAIPKEAKG